MDGKFLTFFDVNEREYRGKVVEWLEDGTLVFESLDIYDKLVAGNDSTNMAGREGTIVFNGDFIKYILLDKYARNQKKGDES